ncbi:Type II secretory pathway, ATPase PulE/Tfp pilus assembly pathway, ATPase PilB [Alkalihalophilus pseudofirmus OF4]|uniref:Type II secretory pathway, ATPase PulE/Tfp pilus assembly pathway, ATPase PilB n=1 Tax=Alkalihalophilus pseudofirmus (strain ATCC BAA-2126 / JCM 17055 / OF4) TaxID=398511 RepID=D3FWB0_ALKPO|nr:ATPase, T2SS/T4P/T4SS family [Alkalihalophilus pseudofirmus]ADC48642.1 Type II secretory pathway, ATPase PulE/Tfp pilus assembly pathway, ATPase PilB [Alkalihalophilus pseudofirmus OF4]
MARVRKRIGDLLVDAGFLTSEQLKQALGSKKPGQKLGDALLELNYISEAQLIEALEVQLGIKHVSLFRYPIDTSLMKMVPKEFAMRNQLIPLKKEGNMMYVAMVDPMDYYAIDDLRMSTGFQIEAAIATKDEVEQAIERHYQLDDAFLQAELDEKDLEALANANPADADEEDAPVIKLVNQILQAGLVQKASDIHIDPMEKKIVIRYRVDGVLKTERVYPKRIQNSLVARLKIMANLNITEVRLPQDGRIKTSIQMTPIDLRISTLPTVYGEKVVIRILDLGSTLNKLSQLGFNKINHQRFLKMIEQPSGLILITGPTGSGKSSTLYAALNHVHSEQVNIITIEDPVEYQIEGINQVQVNAQVGLTFAAGLRSVLRQDPNIVMVGEIRDTETAEIAIRASLTGHLVLSTLHTNSAIATIPRLIDMGIEPYLVVSSLSGIVAQRLVRKICPMCAEEFEPTEMERNLFEKRGIKPSKVKRGSGCPSCNATGYKGRLAIQEVLMVTDDIRQMMMNNKSMSTIRDYAMKQGMIFLIDDGLLKVKQGLTTIEEVLRVAMDE